MDPENQDRIKALADEHGVDDLVVVLGAADLESLEVTAETVTVGDPAYVGPLAGVQLGLPVVHILEEEVKEQVDPAIYDEQVGLLEMTLDVEQVREAAKKLPRPRRRLIGGACAVGGAVRLLVRQPAEDEDGEDREEDDRLAPGHDHAADLLVGERIEPPESRRFLVEVVDRAR